jgi:hypothetical protein
MSSRSSGPGRHSAAIALCGLLACVLLAVVLTATAHAAQYKMVACAANNGFGGYSTSTNTASPQNPGGIFSFENYCGPAPDPAGNSAFLRIAENQAEGNAGPGAYGNIYLDTPAFVHFKAAGGWTRQFNSFNDGWRARFWVASACCTAQVMTQGAGLPNSGAQWASTGTFSPHLWEPAFYYDFTRFVYEMQCVRPAGCDRSNFNATDANTFVFILEDDQNSQVSLTNGSPLMDGGWVRGAQNATFAWSEHGSGIRFERIRIDGAERWSIDHLAAGECSLGSSQVNGEFARAFQACATADNIGRSYGLDTASLADGAHTLQACTQDYGQAAGLNGTGSESCDQRTIHTDNTAPGAPSGLRVTSDNPQRYLDHFGAIFSLPPNQGSPIAKVHYNVVDASGKVVVPEKVAVGTNPTELANVPGPPQADEYYLRVWLEDEVGFVGPAASAPIPRDTTPPSAPQSLSVATPSTPRAGEGFDVRWRNIIDAGSPIDAAHYQVVDAAGSVVVPTKTITAANPQAIENLDTARERGAAALRLWLSDAEGNVGAPATVPLAYDCVRSDVVGGLSLTAGFGQSLAPSMIVKEREGTILSGKLQGAGQLTGAPLCVFSNVVTDQDRQFLGIAIATQSGEYRFPVAPGPSRHFTVDYRPGHRELTASATLATTVRPTLTLGRKVTHNKGVAVFKTAIPGPHNDDVVVVLRVKDGKHWRAFRRCRTRGGGMCVMRYRFLKTTTATKYPMRAEVPNQSGYPYEGGSSALRTQVVLP